MELQEIVKTLPGKDGHVRSFLVKEGSEALARRPVEKLYRSETSKSFYIMRSLEAGECKGDTGKRKIGIGKGEEAGRARM